MRIALALAMLTAAARAEEIWPTFGNPYKFTEQGGEAIFDAACAGCHMLDGRGASGAATYPSLADNPRLATLSYPIGMVLRGQKAMPPFRSFLTDEQIAAVVSYTRTHFGNNFADAPTAAEVGIER
jgi:mono/diheme cytochrome c family protein